MSRRRIYRVLAGIALLVLSYAIYYLSLIFQIAAGGGAKIMCSAVFISGRKEENIKAEDLHFFPLTLASYKIDYKDSTVTCSILELFKARAIYRNGLGSTLVNGLAESEIRGQQFNIPAPPLLNTDTIPWPMGDNITGSYPAGVDSLKIAEAVTRVFNNNDTSFTNLTRAVMVVYNGKVVAERYAAGFTKYTRLTGWSMTKSITGAMVGILVNENKLSLDGPAPVPEWQAADDPRHPITLRQLLQQTTGINFAEVYDKPSDANRMLFTKADAAAFTASHKISKAPGTHFRYSSGNSNILSRICRQTIGEKDYHAFPYNKLFYKLGMYHTVIEPDPSGTFVGSSFCYATLRDWTRFGLLYFNNGRAGDQQLFSTDWVRLSTTPSSAATMGEYGFQWWLNAGATTDPMDRKFPGLPTDMYYASGYEGQNIFIIPSEKLLVVRLGLTRNQHWGETELLTSIIGAIKK